MRLVAFYYSHLSFFSCLAHEPLIYSDTRLNAQFIFQGHTVCKSCFSRLPFIAKFIIYNELNIRLPGASHASCAAQQAVIYHFKAAKKQSCTISYGTSDRQPCWTDAESTRLYSSEQNATSSTLSQLFQCCITA